MLCFGVNAQDRARFFFYDGYHNLFPKLYIPSYVTAADCCLVIFTGLHEEVDYGEKLKFSDDEEDHTGEKSRMR